MTPRDLTRIVIVVASLSAIVGTGLAFRLLDDTDPAAPDTGTPHSVTSTTSTSTAPPQPPANTSSTTPDTIAVTTTTTRPVIIEVRAPPPDLDGALSIADELAADIVMPSDCGLPLGVPESLPNSPRSYRNGVHAGIDFICREYGRDAVAALPGRVVMVVDDYLDPEPADRRAVLDITVDAGRTPPWTLAMMYGNFVVIDHGVRPGIGHMISIYAHLNDVDDAIRPGRSVTAGQRLGEIGNIGTNTAASGGNRPQSIHLHWEIHVDDVYLGAGLDPVQTRSVYEHLFSGSL